MPHSMTAYSSLSGTTDRYEWVWELRSVNAKGLDLRLRVPDWIDGLEAAVRKALTDALARGSVQLTLKVIQLDRPANSAIETDAINDTLDHLSEIAKLVTAANLPIAPVSLFELAQSKPTKLDPKSDPAVQELRTLLNKQVPQLVDALLEMRAVEGQSLTAVLMGQLDAITNAVHAAKACLPNRADAHKKAFSAAIERLDVAAIEPDRLAQEMAILAVKTDITEELDRLDGHISAARSLLSDSKPMGRRLDFLMQEFNREANTLCSKSGSRELTAIGLDLKVVIDQMREQVQNME